MNTFIVYLRIYKKVCRNKHAPLFISVSERTIPAEIKPSIELNIY